MRNKILRHVKQAITYQVKSEAKLNDALQAWLDQYDFAEEIRHKFAIAFTSGSETTVSYNGVDTKSFTDLTALVNLNKESVISLFDMEL